MGDQTTKTVQLRRYTVADGELDAFLDWFENGMVVSRREHGFTVESVFVSRPTNEVIWTVSYPGDEQDFLAAQETYGTSPTRLARAEGVPNRVTNVVAGFVEPRNY